MTVKIEFTEEMKSKGFPGHAMLDRENNVVSYDTDAEKALKQAEEKGHDRNQLMGITCSGPGMRHYFT